MVVRIPQILMVGLGMFSVASVPAGAQEHTPDQPFVVVLGIAQDGGVPQAGTKEHPGWDDPGANGLCLAGCRSMKRRRCGVIQRRNGLNRERNPR